MSEPTAPLPGQTAIALDPPPAPHYWVEITRMGQQEREFICTECDARVTKRCDEQDPAGTASD